MASGLQHATQRPIQTRFRFGSPSLVNLATYRNSQAHSSKGTPSRPPCGDDSLTVCKPTVSGTISLPSRGAFHLSLTVLVRYRSPGVFSLGEWSPRIPTEFLVVRGTQDPDRSRCDFAYGALTPCGGPFQALQLSRRLITSYGPSYNPVVRRRRFGLFPVRSPLLGE